MARLVCGLKNMLVFGSLCIFCTCGGQRATTQELLDATFLTANGAAVELVSPGDNTAAGLNPNFVWSTRAGVIQYRLEVSSTSDFSQLVLDKKIKGTNYMLVNSDLSGISNLDSVAYYWRVSAYPNNQLQSRIFTIQVVGVTATSGGNFYVDASFDPTLTKTSYGNKSAPYRSINEGIVSANIARNSNPAIQVNVLVSKGTYAEQVQMLANIGLYGGYDSSQSWGRNITANVSKIQAPADRAVTCSTAISSSYMNGTQVDGFTILVASTTVATYGFYLNLCSMRVSSNIISVFSSSPTAASTPAYGIFNAFSNGIYAGNTIYANARTSQSFGIYEAINSGSFGNTVVIANNIIVSSSGYSGASTTSSYGIWSQFFNFSSATITNNTIIMAGRNETTAVYGMYNSKVTNNFAVTLGNLSQRVNFSEFTAVGNADTPRSLENNLMWDGYIQTSFYDLYADGVAFTCTYANLTCRNSIATIEALTDWVGGTDKARGNILFPQGVTATPFVNIPRFVEYTTSAGTTTTLPMTSTTGQNVSDYIEVNRDGIPRLITTVNAGVSVVISGSTPLASSSTAGMEIRNWGTLAGANTCFTNAPNTICAALAYDLHLAQNTLSAANWNNLRYGGKDTSGNNCGAPGGGPGVGAGGESCGNVTTDRDGVARTTANAGSATNTNNGGVPGGFSIGAYESD